MMMMVLTWLVLTDISLNWTYSFILLTDEHQNIEESVHGNDVGNDKSMEVLKTRLFLVDFMTGDFKF